MTHQPAASLAHIAGSRQPKIVLVGEAWGESEAQLKLPLCGEAGKELFRMLGEAFPEIEPGLHAEITELHRYGLAWVKRREAWFEAVGIALTNVLAFRPPDNKMEALCGNKKDAGGDSYKLPPLTKGKYLLPEYLSEVSRLQDEIRILSPNLIVALGNTASWATLQATNIGSIRGAVASGVTKSSERNFKVLPTYHPAGVLRNWAWRPIVVADLMKAKREAEFPEIRRPKRQILINPTHQEFSDWIAMAIAKGSITKPLLVGADTETEAGQITCLSLAISAEEAMTVPFWDKRQPGYSYWSEDEERLVWEHLKFFMESPRIRLLWQNGMYDFQYVTPMKIKIHRSTEDTMLLHHSMYPELQKGLGFMGSLYSNESSWKLMRNWKADSEKRDE